MVHQTGEAPDPLLEDALAIVENEREIIRTERDAFRDFRAAVEETTTRPPTAPTAVTRQHHDRSGTRIASLRAAYRETVMSVPHYETEYGEPLETNAEFEFGPDVAALLRTDGPVGDHHKRVLTCVATSVIEDRTQLLDALSAEQSSLEQIQEPVQSVLDAVDSIAGVDTAPDSPALRDGYRRRAQTIRRRCHSLIERRQSEIVGDRRALSLPISGPDLPSYLYDALPVTYPVIAPLTEALELLAGFDSLASTDHSISP